MTAPRVAVAVTHVSTDPRRRQMLRDLITSLGGLGAIYQQTTTWRVIDDPERSGCYEATRRAWSWLTAHARGASHGIVLSDDFVAVPDLLAALNLFAGMGGADGGPAANVVQLYQRRREVVEAADAAGSAWTVTRCNARGGSGMWPLPLADEALRWIAASDARYGPLTPHDDEARVIWQLLSGTPARFWHTTPSLLEHVGGQASLVGHRMTKPARRFDPDRSALDYGWTRGVDAPGVVEVTRLGTFAVRAMERFGGPVPPTPWRAWP